MELQHLAEVSRNEAIVFGHRLSLLVQRGRMEGFIVLDYMPRASEAIAALAGWVQAGKLKHQVDVQHGLENAPATLRRLFEGRNEGKQLLRVAE